MCTSTPEEVAYMKKVPYASAVGSIMYAVRCTRPDVAFAQNLVSRYQQNPGKLHWVAVKHILKYLRNTRDMFLVYRGNPDDNEASMPYNFDELLQSITYIVEDQAPKKIEVAQEQERYDSEIEAIHQKLMACKTRVHVTEITLVHVGNGLLLEFKNYAERILLAVAQKPNGRRNWIVSDQDPSLLEFAWLKLLEGNKSMIFGDAEPVVSHCVHLLFSRDEIYFIVLDSKGSSSIYGPRSTAQELASEEVEASVEKNNVDEEHEMLENDWDLLLESMLNEMVNVYNTIFVLDGLMCSSLESKLIPEHVLRLCLEHDRTSIASHLPKNAYNFYKISYARDPEDNGISKDTYFSCKSPNRYQIFPVHVNLDLLKFNIRTNYPDIVFFIVFMCTKLQVFLALRVKICKEDVKIISSIVI
ncbi:hypothetical protein Tco_0771125 [Tanacetum coccineum]|uniref:Ribonuclease II winged helix domain-containing protein n=1 Tax=Tanacetum coccineum TaxID=301880 RepID=A0ABQ4ZE58_9ASTR